MKAYGEEQGPGRVRQLNFPSAGDILQAEQGETFIWVTLAAVPR